MLDLLVKVLLKALEIYQLVHSFLTLIGLVTVITYIYPWFPHAREAAGTIFELFIAFLDWIEEAGEVFDLVR